MLTGTMKETLHTLATRPTHHIGIQAPRALVVSAVAAGVDCGLLALFVSVWHWPGVTAALLSYLLGGVVQYWLCMRWVFPVAPRNSAVGFTTFTVLSLVGLLITVMTIWMLHTQGGAPLGLAKAAALALAFTWNFFSRKYIIFGDTSKKIPATIREDTSGSSSMLERIWAAVCSRLRYTQQELISLHTAATPAKPKGGV